MSAVAVVGARADADRVKMLGHLASGLWSHELMGHEQMLSLIRPLIGAGSGGSRPVATRSVMAAAAVRMLVEDRSEMGLVVGGRG